MAVEVRKKEGESSSALIYRFIKKTQRSGLKREVKRRRFHARPSSRTARRLSALHREKKRVERERARKLGSP
ncbi:MAG: 30S ribosomal protein S21 [Candidatus Colwellbacteria bacterium]|nr:30S ribosomal protein S21 [Candidatus Colwellbacteria bacterium]